MIRRGFDAKATLALLGAVVFWAAVPLMLRYLAVKGIVPDGSKAYYVINCFAANDPKASPGELGPDMEMHNTEMAYMFALGMFFTNDTRRREIYKKRLDRFLDLAVKLDMNRPARAFNWAFQFTSQLVYFAQHPSEGAK